MKKSIRKNINRVINKITKLTGSKYLELCLLNLASKTFVNINNRIKLDKPNSLYWLMDKNTYLLSVERPYFDFSKTKFFNRCDTIFCHKYVPKKGDVILDIGAGIGMEMCYFIDKVGNKGLVYAIEASTHSFVRLKLLKENNQYLNCKLFNLAISNSNGSIWIDEAENYRVNSVNTQGQGFKIKSMTLDHFVEVNDISRIDLLKVNIEGAELEMIEGMKCISIINNVAISCHDFLNTRDTNIMERVTYFLEQNNFKITYKKTGNKILDSWIYGTKN